MIPVPEPYNHTMPGYNNAMEGVPINLDFSALRTMPDELFEYNDSIHRLLDQMLNDAPSAVELQGRIRLWFSVPQADMR